MRALTKNLLRKRVCVDLDFSAIHFFSTIFFYIILYVTLYAYIHACARTHRFKLQLSEREQRYTHTHTGTRTHIHRDTVSPSRIVSLTSWQVVYSSCQQTYQISGLNQQRNVSFEIFQLIQIDGKFRINTTIDKYCIDNIFAEQNLYAVLIKPNHFIGYLCCSLCFPYSHFFVPTIQIPSIR